MQPTTKAGHRRDASFDWRSTVVLGDASPVFRWKLPISRSIWQGVFGKQDRICASAGSAFTVHPREEVGCPPLKKKKEKKNKKTGAGVVCVALFYMYVCFGRRHGQSDRSWHRVR
jgi:hypothetical protein